MRRGFILRQLKQLSPGRSTSLKTALDSSGQVVTESSGIAKALKAR